MKITIVEEDTITGTYEFNDAEDLISFTSEYHETDEFKLEKFDSDFEKAYETGKFDNFDLVTTEYLYQPNHFNVAKIWNFLRKGEYKYSKCSDYIGITVKGNIHVRADESRRVTRVTLEDGKEKQHKRR